MSFWEDLGNMLDPTRPLHDLGILPTQVNPDSPGASVDTTNADQQRASMAPLMAQLQQQAATGGGAWEGALANTTQNAANTASSLALGENGQSNLNRRYEMGAGGAAARQRGVGEGNILRAQSEQDAQGQLSDLLAAQNAGDINQAQAQASALQQNRETNAALGQQAKQNTTQMVGGLGQMAAALSGGGAVPGKPRVPGDSPLNDTVPAQIEGGGRAKLSPGELVVPRSHSDSPQHAMQWIVDYFTHAHGGRDGGFADGGDTGLTPNGVAEQPKAADEINPASPLLSQWNHIYGTDPQAASIENGALLNTAPYAQSRGQVGSLADLLAARAKGGGASAAPQEATNAQDAAMSAGPMGFQRAVEVASSPRAAETKAREQSAAEAGLGKTLVGQRNRDLAMAMAQHEAAARNTQLNAGLTLANQAQLRNILSGAGQAVQAYSSTQAGRYGEGGDPSENELGPGGGAPEYNDGTYGNPDDFTTYEEATATGPGRGGPSDISGGENFAHGGLIDYLARGGKVVAHDPEEHTPGKNYMPKVGVGEYDKQFPAYPRGKPQPYEEEDKASDFEVQRARGGSIPGYADGGMPPLRIPEEMRWQGTGYGAPVQEPPPEPPDNREQWEKNFDKTPAGKLAKMLPGGLTGNQAAVAGYAAPLVLGPAALPVEAGITYGRLKGKEQGAKASEAKGVVDQKSVDSMLHGAADLGSKLLVDQKPSPNVATKPTKPTNSPVGPDYRGQEGEATRREYEAAGEGQKTLAKAAQDEQAMLAAQDEEARRTQARQQQYMAESLRKQEALNEQIVNMDTSVDPGRYWASRSTGQKITNIIGLALGALGTGPDGINRAASMMTAAIDRDIDAQKAEHQFRLTKGRAALEGAQSIYGLHHQQMQDETAALHASKATALEISAAKVRELTSTTQSQVMKQQGAALEMGLKAQGEEEKKKAAFEAAKIGLEREKLGILRSKAGGGGKNAGLASGALQAIDDLENEFKKNPLSPQIAQKRASFMLELNKLQGGRFNKEIHELNQELTPGSSEYNSALTRLAYAMGMGGLMANKFNTLREHTLATANMPPNPAYGGEE